MRPVKNGNRKRNEEKYVSAKVMKKKREKKILVPEWRNDNQFSSPLSYTSLPQTQRSQPKQFSTSTFLIFISSLICRKFINAFIYLLYTFPPPIPPASSSGEHVKLPIRWPVFVPDTRNTSQRFAAPVKPPQKMRGSSLEVVWFVPLALWWLVSAERDSLNCGMSCS